MHSVWFGGRCYHKFEKSKSVPWTHKTLYLSVWPKWVCLVSWVYNNQHVVVHNLDFNQQFLKYHTNKLLPNCNLSPNSFYAKNKTGILRDSSAFRSGFQIECHGNFCLLLRIEQMANNTKTNHLNKSIIQFCAQDTSPGISMRFVFVHNYFGHTEKN